MFHPLPNIPKEKWPQQFTYPFCYKAHPLCIEASNALQKKLLQWNWSPDHEGKMFGVLLVENPQGELGYLWAYSGNFTTKLDATVFVPPIYDLLSPKSFFQKGEKELDHINAQIELLQTTDEYLSAIKAVEDSKAKFQQQLAIAKTANQTAKKRRKELRKNGAIQLSQEEYQILEAKLVKESQRQKSLTKQLKHKLKQKLDWAEQQLAELDSDIEKLKTRRKEKSAALQQRLFDQYQLKNAKGNNKGMRRIFIETLNKQAPAGAGDCAAPRLLQYAYLHKLRPVAMAEFWWGRSPASVIRKHGNYYPACKGKCEPILGHMLQGLDVEPNPLLEKQDYEVEVIFEDEYIMAVNKPAGLLSVKGKKEISNLVEMLRIRNPKLELLLPAHRLDMATSGIMLLAKTKEVYKTLQHQFEKRQIKKRYEALLDGKIKNNSGKIELPLRVDLNNRPQQMVCNEHGKPALTQYKIIKVENQITRVAFYPITGRTHQLRVHAAHPLGLNAPIIGDALYGTPAERLCLHAASIRFVHPHTDEEIHIKCEVPF